MPFVSLFTNAFLMKGLIKMKRLLSLILLMFCLVSNAALAASFKNLDAKTQSILVTEGSSRRDISIKTDQSIDICSKGCFVTFPNGDHFAIKSEDVIEINGNRASFK